MPTYNSSTPTLQNATVAPYLIKGTDFSTLQHAIDTMSERHIKALDARAGIAKDISEKYNLNEAEDGWKTDFTNEMLGQIDNAVDSNSGYAGNALTAALDVTKKYVSDPRLLGRQRAQVAYQKYMDEIDKSNISDDQKQFLREQNPYWYFDKYEGETEADAIKNRTSEAQGLQATPQSRIVGGTTWSKDKSIVAEQDINAFMGRVLQQVGRDTGFDWEILSAGKIKSAIENAFDADENMSSWLQRQYELLQWKFERNPREQNPLLVDENGITRSFDDYKANIINKFAKTAAYSKYVGPRTSAAGGSGGSGRSRSNSVGSGSSGDEGNPLSQLLQSTVAAGSRQVSNESNAAVLTRMLDIRDSLEQLFDDYFPDADNKFPDNLAEIKGNPEKMAEILLDNTKVFLKPNEAAAVRTALVQWRNDNTLMSGVSQDVLEAQTFKAALESGSRISTLVENGNKYAIEYQEYLNNLINKDCKGHDFIYIPVTNSDTYTAWWSNEQERQYHNIKSKQYDIVDGYIKIPRSDAYALYAINNDLINCGLTLGGITSHFIKGTTGQTNAGANITNATTPAISAPTGIYVRETVEGSGEPAPFTRIRNDNWTNDFINNLDNPMRKANNYLAQLKATDTPVYDLPVTVLPIESQLLLLAADYGLNSQQQQLITNEIDNAIKTPDVMTWSNAQISIGGKDNRRPILPNAISDVQSLLSSIYSNSSTKGRVSISTDLNFNGYVINVAADQTGASFKDSAHAKDRYLGVVIKDVVPSDEGYGNEALTGADAFSIYIPNLVKNRAIDQLLGGLTNLEQRQKLSVSELGNSPMLLNDCLPVNTETSMYITPNGNGSFSVGNNNATYGILSKDEAAALLTVKDRISELYSQNVSIPANALASLIYPQNTDYSFDANNPVDNFLLNIVATLCKSFGEPFVENGKVASDNWSPGFKEIIARTLGQISK